MDSEEFANQLIGLISRMIDIKFKLEDDREYHDFRSYRSNRKVYEETLAEARVTIVTAMNNLQVR